jgi:microcystin-dependent protein
MEPFIGQIIMFAGNFAPRGWALCDGQLLEVSTHSALFSILGTTYGGDGRTTFGLPDLRGRVPMHAGHGPGLSNRKLGEKGGTETVTLGTNEIPTHHHLMTVTDQPGSVGRPSDQYLATNEQRGQNDGTPIVGENAHLNQAAIQNTGGGQPHANVQPFQTVHYIIALTGLFPSRS